MDLQRFGKDVRLDTAAERRGAGLTCLVGLEQAVAGLGILVAVGKAGPDRGLVGLWRLERVRRYDTRAAWAPA